MINQNPRPAPAGWDRQWTPKPGDASLWVQWKGSIVCAEFRCSCGNDPHLDIEDQGFLYHIQCMDCGSVYMVNANVELVKLTDEEAAGILKTSGCVVEA